jgi:hypothetical protein
MACAATVAYWQFDESTDANFAIDAVGSHDMVYQAGKQHYIPAIQVITNPDPGPFSVGTPEDNPRSMRFPWCHQPAGSSLGPFGMRDTPWTFEGYVYREDLSSSDFIASTRSAETGWVGWELGNISSGRFDFRISEPFGNSAYVNSGETVLIPGEWYHFALIWDPDASTWGTVSIYINHVLANSNPEMWGDIGEVAGEYFMIGGRDHVADGVNLITQLQWNGSLDEFRWSDVVLDPTEFLPLPNPPVPAGPMDFNLDGIVNLADLAIFAADYMMTSETYVP